MNTPGTLQNKFRFVGPILLVAGIVTAPGCTICCQPYLDDYVAFGSSTPRVDMKHGRVGSPFSDPNLIGEVVHESAFARDGAISDPNAVLYYESEVPAEINSELSLDPSR